MSANRLAKESSPYLLQHADCLGGGPEMAPTPPTLGRAPAKPWRASIWRVA
jgi:hypothetical protein